MPQQEVNLGEIRKIREMLDAGSKHWQIAYRMGISQYRVRYIIYTYIKNQLTSY